ncbi:MAG: hypothetical protein ACR2KB_09830 [Chitinophagaceae bacterium]
MTQIRSEYRTKMQALRNDNSLNQEQKRTKMQDFDEGSTRTGKNHSY